MAIPKISNSFHPSFNHSVHFEIRLFYVRISPCVPDAVPDHLTLRHLHRELGVSVEINGLRVPELNPANVTLKRDRLDKDSLEVTYVSTDSVRISGGVEFEVLEKEGVILCGSLERMDDNWVNGVVGLDNDSGGTGTGTGSGWSMDCYVANLMGSADSSAFFQPKLGVSSPSIEVYIAGCCARVPLILTKTIQLSPRRKVSKQSMLDAIPEYEEIGKGQKIGSDLFFRRSTQIIEPECYDYEDSVDGKFGGCSFYHEEMCISNGGGELSWFNAGVRVGVGIGLGMCVGVGIGVGLLMRSYQSTTRNFRRRFF